MHLASESRRAGVSVACRDRVVDVDLNTRVGSLVRARERDEVRWRLAAAASNLKLCTGQVELGSTYALSSVDGDVLVAHQVFARCNALRDLDVVGGSACAD